MTSAEKYMHIAVGLAKKAEGMTSPNPIVGAVVVRNGRIVGKGYHKACGLPHAEVNALRSAGGRAKGADLYVTLEPCDHFGRTPPCTMAIIGSGIKRVFIGMKDPNPINNGKGIKRLKKAGIKTLTGILAGECRSMNRPYIKFITTGMPYVTLKMAQSLDGKIATKTGESKWITSDSSRVYVQRLRSKADAVMVGGNTVLKDDPSLSCRIPGLRQPVKVVVGGSRRIPRTSRIFGGKKGGGVIVAAGSNGRVQLRPLLKDLGKMGLLNILAEGGGELAASLIAEGLVDRFLFFIAPKIIGGRSALTSVEGIGVRRLPEAAQIKNFKAIPIGPDILIEGYA
jgi:diaminohydroxyphosphoribosylaminopyrimidine deaminase/5-amino-6-(5-phosphoribosylamino)uracil reductase